MLRVIVTSTSGSSSNTVTDAMHVTDLINNPYVLLFWNVFVYYQMGWTLTLLYPMVVMAVNSLSKSSEALQQDPYENQEIEIGSNS